MACLDDQQPNFKHYCRVCKKGFMCGRALGGHMRAHGIGDENGILDDDDDDPASDWEDKLGGGSEARNSNKRMYQLRTNPNRLKSCRTCENCGKEFLSWKSFLEHGKCSSDDASESLASSGEEEGRERHGDGGGGGGGWSKRKRSLRSKVGCLGSTYVPSEEDDLLLARCLVQLANTTVDPPAVAQPEESCASASREEERRNPTAFFSPRPTTDKAKGASSARGLFECKACNKVFNSHQALGGHRASHKKVKGCYAAKQDLIDDNSNFAAEENDTIITNEGFFPSSKLTPSFQLEQGPALVGPARRKSKVHECSICHRVFTSGQALGGHKRCHWITSNSPDASSSLPKFHLTNNIEPVQHHHEPNMEDASAKLDLNVPAWAHVAGIKRDPRNPLSFEVSTEMHLEPWIGHGTGQQLQQIKNDAGNNNTNNNCNDVKNETNGKVAMRCVEDEADSNLKVAKLSDLNDLKHMGNSGDSSQWLQVGIGSATEATAAAAAAADA